MNRISKAHVSPISKRTLQKATALVCDNHETEKKRDKCHKGKIAPPNRTMF